MVSFGEERKSWSVWIAATSAGHDKSSIRSVGMSPFRPVTVRKRAQGCRRSQRRNLQSARPFDWRAIAGERPWQDRVAADGEGQVAFGEHRAVRQIVDRPQMPALVAAVATLTIELRVERQRTQRAGWVDGADERRRPLAPAFEARPVPRGERRRFVEKKEIGIA